MAPQLGKALCTPAGTRSRVVECVKLEAGAVVSADGECDDAVREESIGVPCTRRCYNNDIRHKRVESECTPRGADACGVGDITITFELCADPTEAGCRCDKAKTCSLLCQWYVSGEYVPRKFKLSCKGMQAHRCAAMCLQLAPGS